MHYTYQCDQLTLLYLSVPLLVYFNKLQNSSEIATYKPKKRDQGGRDKQGMLIIMFLLLTNSHMTIIVYRQKECSEHMYLHQGWEADSWGYGGW